MQHFYDICFRETTFLISNTFFLCNCNMEEAILCIVLLVLSIGLVTFAIMKKPFGLYGVDYIFSIIGILLVFYCLFDLAKACKVWSSTEGFVNAIGLGGSVKNNEDLSSFSRNLTIYYSGFSTLSYPHSTKRWLNISPYFSSPQNVCPDIKIEDTNAEFLDVPSYSPENGFALGLNRITGPMSHRMGINANDSFSIFFSMSFNEFLTNEENDLNLLRIYANTKNNIGLSMDISKDYTVQPNGLAIINGTFTFGNQTEQLVIPQITPDQIYLFVIIKQGHNFLINAYPNVGDLASNVAKHSTLAKFSVSNEDVLLSNKEMMINGSRNIQAHIHTFGVYNKAIANETITAIYTNLQKQIQKYSQVLQDLNAALAKINKKMDDMKKCPYDKKTCDACTSVKDWSNMTDLILNASPDCMKAIHEYCVQNPGKDICACWNPSNILSQTNACKSYTAIYNGGSCITPDNLDTKTIDVIKAKYNFCSCTEVPPKPAGPVVKAIVVPKPKVLNNYYNLNSSDMDLYNALPIGTKMIKDPFQTGGLVPQN